MREVLCWSPRVLRVAGAVPVTLTDALIELARPRLKPSVALDTTVENKRTSHGTFFGGEWAEHDAVRAVRELVSAEVALPPANAEPMQLLRYTPGQEYKLHVDYIPPKSARAADRLAKGGQRVLTALVYLNDVDDGGATVFPRVELAVPARRGDLLIFHNVLPTHRVDRRSLHAGTPVVRGEKWLATLWYRERAYATA
jgi:prolyl 4-hydroxylase